MSFFQTPTPPPGFDRLAGLVSVVGGQAPPALLTWCICISNLLRVLSRLFRQR